MPLPLVAAAIGGGLKLAAGIGNTIAGLRGARNQEREANQILSRGEAAATSALEQRSNYYAPEQVQSNLNRALNERGASPVKDQLRAESLATGARMASNIKRSATSASSSILGATLADNAIAEGNREAAILGEQDRQQREANVMSATDRVVDQAETQYEINVQEPFALKYQAAQDMIGAGLAGKFSAMNNRTKAWQSGFSALAQADSGGGGLLESLFNKGK